MLTGTDEHVELVVRDDGSGHEAEEGDTGGMGMGIMAERAASIGATFEVAAVDPTGTSVAVAWEGGADA